MKDRLLWINLRCHDMRYLMGSVPHVSPRTRDVRAYEYFAAPRLMGTVIQLLNAAEAAAHDAESASH